MTTKVIGFYNSSPALQIKRPTSEVNAIILHDFTIHSLWNAARDEKPARLLPVLCLSSTSSKPALTRPPPPCYTYSDLSPLYPLWLRPLPSSVHEAPLPHGPWAYQAKKVDRTTVSGRLPRLYDQDERTGAAADDCHTNEPQNGALSRPHSEWLLPSGLVYKWPRSEKLWSTRLAGLVWLGLQIDECRTEVVKRGREAVYCNQSYVESRYFVLKCLHFLFPLIALIPNKK